jgi:hypothetical protein
MVWKWRGIKEQFKNNIHKGIKVNEEEGRKTED